MQFKTLNKMGQDLQNLFASDGSAWSAKYFKEKMLTALTVDLAKREADGIKQEVCDKVYETLNVAVAITDRIKDGTFFEAHFFKQLEDFRDHYEAWNNVKTRPERKTKLTILLKRKKIMFSSFYAEMDKLKKTNNEERIRQFQLLSSHDRETLDALVLSFEDLTKTYGKDIFVNTKKALSIFKKRRGGK